MESTKAPVTPIKSLINSYMNYRHKSWVCETPNYRKSRLFLRVSSTRSSISRSSLFESATKGFAGPDFEGDTIQVYEPAPGARFATHPMETSDDNRR